MNCSPACFCVLDDGMQKLSSQPTAPSLGMTKATGWWWRLTARVIAPDQKTETSKASAAKALFHSSSLDQVSFTSFLKPFSVAAIAFMSEGALMFWPVISAAMAISVTASSKRAPRPAKLGASKAA